MALSSSMVLIMMTVLLCLSISEGYEYKGHYVSEARLEGDASCYNSEDDIALAPVELRCNKILLGDTTTMTMAMTVANTSAGYSFVFNGNVMVLGQFSPPDCHLRITIPLGQCPNLPLPTSYIKVMIVESLAYPVEGGSYHVILAPGETSYTNTDV